MRKEKFLSYVLGLKRNVQKILRDESISIDKRYKILVNFFDAVSPSMLECLKTYRESNNFSKSDIIRKFSENLEIMVPYNYHTERAVYRFVNKYPYLAPCVDSAVQGYNYAFNLNRFCVSKV